MSTNKVKISKSKLDALANAFRSKLGTEDSLTLEEMIVEIPNLNAPDLEGYWLIVDCVDIPSGMKSFVSGKQRLTQAMYEGAGGWQKSDRVEVLDGGNCWRAYFPYTPGMSTTISDDKNVQGIAVGWYDTKYMSYSKQVKFDPATVENGLLKQDNSYRYVTPTYIRISCNKGQAYGL